MNTLLLDYRIQEKLVTVPNVSWEEFKAIEAQLKDNSNVRLSYLSGMLEIMSLVNNTRKLKVPLACC